MIAVVCATKMEAAPIIKRLGAVAIDDSRFPVCSFHIQNRSLEGRIIISGMGKVCAEKATDYICSKFKTTRVINIGICGALQGTSEKGNLYRISEVKDGDDPEGKVPILCRDSGDWKPLESNTLVTVTKPVMDLERRDSLAAHGGLVDMEGVAIARTCESMNIPCELIKGVSDHADDDGKQDIGDNIDEVSARLADILATGLTQTGEGRHGHLAKLLNFIKFEHTVFSLPLLFSGAWLGAGGTMPEMRVLLLVLAAGVGGRSLGMAMNRIMDRKLDALNERTASRELPSGKVSLLQAYSVAAAGLMVYMLACAGLGRLCLILSPVPLIPLITYSLLKRFTCLCHYGIGICLALAPLGAYVAASGSVDPAPAVLLLSLFTFCWISGYDIIYALQDMKADIENGVHSIPAAIGYKGAEAVAGITHAVAGGALIALWFFLGGGVWSLIALLTSLAALCVGYLQSLPLNVRFFPTSAVAGIAGALVPILGELL